MRLLKFLFIHSMNASTISATEALEIQAFQAYTYARAVLPCKLDNADAYEAAQTRLFAGVRAAQHRRLTLDMDGMTEYDSYAVVWIAAVKRFCVAENITLDVQGLTEEMQGFISLLEKPLLILHKESIVDNSWQRYVESVGTTTLSLLQDAREFIEFVGSFVINVVQVVRSPRLMRWQEFPAYITKSGVGALPIASLIGLLMGVIVGYQGAVQLVEFGAEMYLADMVAVSMTRELAPLMTAIIVAGRSGAAFAAEIGTMQVSEEVDALQTMGFSAMRFLVLPRVLAVTLVMPLLVLFADMAGILGGLIIANSVLHISISGYLNETKQALSYAHVYTGLFKSLVLGVIIALVGCMRGFQVRGGGAESVGQYTTSAVVTSIFLIILADAVFTVVFQALKL
jgi:phospholipid/cholesterol/gamma-HCH transport system permease protein